MGSLECTQASLDTPLSFRDCWPLQQQLLSFRMRDGRFLCVQVHAASAKHLFGYLPSLIQQDTPLSSLRPAESNLGGSRTSASRLAAIYLHTKKAGHHAYGKAKLLLQPAAVTKAGQSV